MKKYNYIYQITNLINGKIYVGAHSSDILDDDYMGSGIAIRRAIRKYGVDNFQKDILATFDSVEDMFSAEAEIVNLDFVAQIGTYNLREGGLGGRPSEETRKKQSEGIKNSYTASLLEKKSKIMQEKAKDAEYIRNLSEGIRRSYSGERGKKLRELRGASTKERWEALSEKERKERMRKASAGVSKRVTCPHCGKTGGQSNMTRFHFENCKEKK